MLDTEHGVWHRQDDSHALAFAELNGEMYMLLSNGLLYAMNGTAGERPPEDVTWFAETAVMGYEYPDHQYMSRLLLRMKLGVKAECRIYIQYDSDGLWHFKGAFQGTDSVKTYLLPVIPRRCDHLKVRFEGHGDMQLYGMARELALGRECAMTETQAGSGAVLQAKEYLKSVMEGKPSAFRGPYARQIAGLYDSIMNRAAFRYGESKDPLLALNDQQAAPEDTVFQGYLRRLREAGRDGTEVDAWRI